jgi:uncharacterized protein YecT (DUF1311 family)
MALVCGLGATGPAGVTGALAQPAAGLDACLAASPSRDGDLACRDLVFAACQTRTRDDTTVGMAECMAEEQAVWDDLLNALWPQVQDLATGEDAAPQDPVEALVAAQRQWLVFRDAECGWQLRRQSGSIRLILVAACMRDMTAERVADFRGWLRDASAQ